MNLWLIFITGLTSGGVTCAAMQGGILASTIANQNKDQTKSGYDRGDMGSVAAFLTTKFIAHVILGFFLGYLGSRISLTLNMKLFFQGFAALFMFASAMNLLDLHPIFRYLAFSPPSFARKWIKRNTVADQFFAPALLGFLTIFIPCGVTQAMEVLAISSLSPVQGALIMGTFVLGTTPMFVLIGVAASKFSVLAKVYFMRIAAILLIAMSLYSLNGILLVLDSPFSMQRVGPKIVELLPPYDLVENSKRGIDPNIHLVGGLQKVKIDVNNGGYTPKSFVVQKDIPVELTLETQGDVYSCATAFTFKEFKIVDFLKPGDSNKHVFTPTERGIFTFACSMGMYSGTMEVI